jgi:hypothetical protein
MAPLPEAKAEIVNGQIKVTGTGNPGFPFFVPGIAGHRPPAPPLDFACVTDAQGNCVKKNGKIVYEDGGLARHVITGGQVTERHNQWDFTKDNPVLTAKELAEDGEPVEKAAMAYHALRTHPSFTPDGQPANFITNGLAPQPGAPYADPAPYCPSPNDCDGGPANPTVRRYKAADIQMNVTFNKKGWHYPQQRFITLWSDVANTLKGTRAPEPFFFRANSYDVIEYWLTNLVPTYYELDDFQVRTPTDIIGQHIHLVKFDVTSSDGAANGFNYEDGTLSVEEVRDRINAISLGNNCKPSDPVSFKCPKAVAPPPGRFGPDPSKNEQGQSYNWAGAQTTIQRWYADPTLNMAGEDRTLRTVFTHDHFGPSTHQQVGLYAGLVVEPKDSKWFMNDQNTQLGTQDDGGPTSWQARIVTANNADSYREFLLEFQDLSLAYQKGTGFLQSPVPYPGAAAPVVIKKTTPLWGWADPNNAIHPSTGNTSAANKLKTNPTLITGGVITGTMSVNYRNEPLPFRINNVKTDPSTRDPKCPLTVHGIDCQQTDLAYAFSSIKRLDNDLNCQFAGPLVQSTPCTPTPTPAPHFPAFVYPGGTPGASPFDPYTPLMRAYQNDKVQVRVLVGAYLFNHNFSMYGLKWLFEPSASNSGYRDNQAMGISEHFEMLFTVPTTAKVPISPDRVPNDPNGPFSADYLYMPGSGVGDLVNGLWGILRAFNTGGNPGKVLPNLPALPNNPSGGVALSTGTWKCPGTSNITYNVAAINSTGVSNPQPLQLTYNSRTTSGSTSGITNPNALVYVLADAAGKPKTTQPTEPLVLRAQAGDCITVNLFNQFVTTPKSTFGIFTTPDGNANQGTPNVPPIPLFPSTRVGLRPQMLAYDITQSNGANIGFNPDQTVQYVKPGTPVQKRTYQWYAGNISYDAQGNATGTPIEFGSTNLMTADPLEQMPFSLIGALIIEPQNSQWTSVNGSNVTVDVNEKTTNKPLFREFVAITQENVYLFDSNGIANGGPDVFNSVNFGSEPMGDRLNSPSDAWRGFDGVPIGCAFSSTAAPSAQCGLQTVMKNPQTPIFKALAGTPVRFRMLHPDGTGGFPDDVWTIHGHIWQEEPYVSSTAPSAKLGLNPFSQWMGSRDGFGPGNHFDILISSAGGINKVAGDYLYRSFPSSETAAGVWGIFRVCDPAKIGCLTPVRPQAVMRVRRPTAQAEAVKPAEPPVVEKANDPGERFNIRRQARKQRQVQQQQSPEP